MKETIALECSLFYKRVFYCIDITEYFDLFIISVNDVYLQN